MSEPKPFASLTSSLLARKGQAKPAMRPQSFTTFGGIEDLGWNDMGSAPARPQPAVGLVPADAMRPLKAELPTVVRQQAEIAAEFVGDAGVAELDTAEPFELVEVAPEVDAASFEEFVPFDDAAAAEAPAFEARVQPALEMPQPVADAAPLPRVVPTSRVRPGSAKAKAAFTLRLDPERHLKLRLACAVANRSAQQLVTEALDRLLADMPEVDALAGAVPGQN